MSGFANNPFMMNGQNMEMFSGGMEMFKSFMEKNMNWMNNSANKNPQFDMGSYLNESMQVFKEMVSSSTRNADSALTICRRSAEIFQRYASDMFEFMKKVSTVSNSEDALAKQTEFSKELYNNAMADFKELSEMCSKSNFENLAVLNQTFSDKIQQMQDKFSQLMQMQSCNASKSEPSATKKSNAAK